MPEAEDPEPLARIAGGSAREKRYKNGSGSENFVCLGEMALTTRDGRRKAGSTLKRSEPMRFTLPFGPLCYLCARYDG